jgi:predicted transposase YdaD
MQLISGFIDTYLTLTPSEERDFQQELNTFSQPTQEKVMQITTSWMRQGIEQGIEREKALILRLLKRKLGQIPPALETEIMSLNINQIEALGEALLDFSTFDDLINWLHNNL